MPAGSRSRAIPFSTRGWADRPDTRFCSRCAIRTATARGARSTTSRSNRTSSSMRPPACRFSGTTTTTQASRRRRSSSATTCSPTSTARTGAATATSRPSRRPGATSPSTTIRPFRPRVRRPSVRWSCRAAVQVHQQPGEGQCLRDHRHLAWHRQRHHQRVPARIDDHDERPRRRIGQLVSGWQRVSDNGAVRGAVRVVLERRLPADHIEPVAQHRHGRPGPGRNLRRASGRCHGTSGASGTGGVIRRPDDGGGGSVGHVDSRRGTLPRQSRAYSTVTLFARFRG